MEVSFFEDFKWREGKLLILNINGNVALKYSLRDGRQEKGRGL